MKTTAKRVIHAVAYGNWPTGWMWAALYAVNIVLIIAIVVALGQS